MEKQLEDLLWLRTQSLTSEVHDEIFFLIKRICQLSLDLSNEDVCRWIDKNHHDIYLIARDRPKFGSWIVTIEHLNKELINLGILTRQS